MFLSKNEGATSNFNVFSDILNNTIHFKNQLTSALKIYLPYKIHVRSI